MQDKRQLSMSMPAAAEVAAFREDVSSAGGVQRIAEHVRRASVMRASAAETSHASPVLPTPLVDDADGTAPRQSMNEVDNSHPCC